MDEYKIYDREIAESVRFYENQLERARIAHVAAVENLNKARKQEACSAARKHKFVDAGGGMFGGRFKEECSKCGYVNEV